MQKKPSSSLILIHVPIPLPHLQQSLKHLHPLHIQLPGIHQLFVVLPPKTHVALLRHKLGRFAVVRFKKVYGFLLFGEPEFVLGHGLCHFQITGSGNTE